MTKHRDVNKCRRQEKYKMATLIRQANKRANKPKIERTHGKKEGEKRDKTKQHFLRRKRREIMSASNWTKAEYT